MIAGKMQEIDPRVLLSEVNDLRDRVTQLQALLLRLEGSVRVMQLLSASLDLSDVIGHFDREARRLVAFDRMALILVDEDDPSLAHLISADDGRLHHETQPRVLIAGMQVLNECRPLMRELWPGNFSAPDDAKSFAAGMRLVLDMPLTLPDAPLGVASFGRFDGRLFASDETILLGALVAGLGQAVSNCREVARIRDERQVALNTFTPDLVRTFMKDHLHESDDWFQGLTQGLLLTELIDTYQVERLEDWWVETRGPAEERPGSDLNDHCPQ